MLTLKTQKKSNHECDANAKSDSTREYFIHDSRIKKIERSERSDWLIQVALWNKIRTEGVFEISAQKVSSTCSRQLPGSRQHATHQCTAETQRCALVYGMLPSSW